MKEAKEEWIEEQCFIINKKMTAGSSKKVYSYLKNLSETNQPNASVMSDADG
ncbi:hypothetical protein DPMN_009766 [Dreissena polymorpha]|uniref:Uncharacterized protein n=1 Tax=Dreissena polymorpha TaxID=45954 RepID=A0A9D4MXJ9_DREPO|nr:hypothetical protein DPMN_009766 [Dreissena polymorpha]